jgi:hypothetical protein
MNGLMGGLFLEISARDRDKKKIPSGSSGNIPDVARM